MHIHRFKVMTVSGAALALTAASLAMSSAPAGATAPSAAGVAAKQTKSDPLIGGKFSDCFWNYGAVGEDPSFNIAYPDAGAKYWAAYIRRPVGSKLSLKGTYPHARYFSLISYDRVGQPVDGIADYQLPPLSGSKNPYEVGAKRDTKSSKRTYKMTVVHEKNPGFSIKDPRNDQPQRSALYTVPDLATGTVPHATETGSDGVTYELDLMLYRVYIPDKGLDMTGGTGLPQPKLTLANGQVLKGQAACDAMDSQSKDLKATTGNPSRLPDASALTMNVKDYAALRYPWQIADSADVRPDLPGVQVQVFPAPGLPGAPLYQTKRTVADPTAFPATYDPSASRSTPWRAQYTRKYLLQQWTGDDAVGAVTDPQRAGGGFFPNIHNNYIRAALHRSFGKVAVVRGKAFTAAPTRDDVKVTGAYKQVRYASYCMNESVYTTRVMDCVYDEEVPKNSKGNYLIVTSRKADRPDNAIQTCGVGYIEWSKKGDGYKDHDFGWFQVRNMLPNTTFNQAVQNTTVPGDELAVMGKYLPNVEYMSTKKFESLNLKCADTKKDKKDQKKAHGLG